MREMVHMRRQMRVGNPPIEIDLRRSSRARRLSLRISRLDGRVTLTMPNGVPEKEGFEFVSSREDWLRGHLEGISETTVPTFGSRIPYQDSELELRSGAVRRVLERDDALILPDDPEKVGARVQAFLKVKARDRLAEASDRYASDLEVSYRRLSLRDTRSRWGSCTSAGDLMYSWRLIMAPTEVLEYVAAHEVAHLVEMNHSQAFWDVVQSIFPNHRTCRKWLKDNGDMLHRFRFEN